MHKTFFFLALWLLPSFLLAQIGNTVQGDGAGISLTSGNFNTIIGDSAGMSLTTDRYNVFIGHQAGKAQTTLGGQNNAGRNNIFIGEDAGRDNTLGYDNIFIGEDAGESNTEGIRNIFIGESTGQTITTGSRNLYVGGFAGSGTTEASDNVYIGFGAGADQNNTGINNVYIGNSVGTENTSGGSNTFIGQRAYSSAFANDSDLATNFPFSNTTRRNNTGFGNSVIGAGAGNQNTTGNGNTYIGLAAGADGKVESGNTFIGYAAGASNNSSALDNEGVENSYLGFYAGTTNIGGRRSIGIGCQADHLNTGRVSGQVFDNWGAIFIGAFTRSRGEGAIAIGYDSEAIHENANVFNDGKSVAIGVSASSAATNAFALGYQASVSVQNQYVIGNSAVTSIGGPVNWTATSDGRFKKNIQENVPGLTFINHLRPLSYHYDATALHQSTGYEAKSLANALAAKEQVRYSGFLAQEVEKTATALDYDFSAIDQPKNKNDIYGLRYAEFVVPLVKAIQELSADLEEKEKTIATLESKEQIIAQQQTEIEQWKAKSEVLWAKVKQLDILEAKLRKLEASSTLSSNTLQNTISHE